MSRASGCVDARSPASCSAAFLDALVSVVDPRSTHFRKRCVAVSEADATTNPRRLIVHFADGSTHEADVVLGADGIRSTVRDYVVGGEAGSHVAFGNTMAYRGLIPRAVLEAAGFKTDVKDVPACFVGPSKVRSSLQHSPHSKAIESAL